MTKQQQALLAAKVQRAVEIKRIIEDLEEELGDIKNELDLSGLDRLEVDGASAVKVVQRYEAFNQSMARQLLGAAQTRKCLDSKVKIFWKFGS